MKNILIFALKDFLFANANAQIFYIIIECKIQKSYYVDKLYEILILKLNILCYKLDVFRQKFFHIFFYIYLTKDLPSNHFSLNLNKSCNPI